MASEEKRAEILGKLKNGVIEFEEDAVKVAAQEALDEEVDAYDAIMNGLAAGMDVVGGLFSEGEYFVPEVLMSADALYAGLDILKPHVITGNQAAKGAVVIGTVEGDVHDIGKNLVKMMFEVAGFTVYDLGRDVPLEKFIEEMMRTSPNIVCMSAMMTTTMVGMKKVIPMIREQNPKVKVMIGGAPVTAETAESWGADGYGKDAPNALSEALKMVGSLKDL